MAGREQKGREKNKQVQEERCPYCENHLVGVPERQSKELSYTVLERGVFFWRRGHKVLNTAVENRVAPKLGTMERQRHGGESWQRDQMTGYGDAQGRWGTEAAVTEGWKPLSTLGGHRHPQG